MTNSGKVRVIIIGQNEVILRDFILSASIDDYSLSDAVAKLLKKKVVTEANWITIEAEEGEEGK